MIMVDEIKVYPNAWGSFKGGSCHLTTDGDASELHAFAQRIGLDRQWFQARSSTPHYDLTPSRRAMAIRAGAVEVTAREQAIARVKARGKVRHG